MLVWCMASRHNLVRIRSTQTQFEFRYNVSYDVDECVDVRPTQIADILVNKLNTNVPQLK